MTDIGLTVLCQGAWDLEIFTADHIILKSISAVVTGVVVRNFDI